MPTINLRESSLSTVSDYSFSNQPQASFVLSNLSALFLFRWQSWNVLWLSSKQECVNSTHESSEIVSK